MLQKAFWLQLKLRLYEKCTWRQEYMFSWYVYYAKAVRPCICSGVTDYAISHTIISQQHFGQVDVLSNTAREFLDLNLWIPTPIWFEPDDVITSQYTWPVYNSLNIYIIIIYCFNISLYSVSARSLSKSFNYLVLFF